jgi:hypothetical protein
MSRKKRDRKERGLHEQQLLEIQRSQNTLAKRALKDAPGEPAPVLLRNPESVGMRKMSEILLEFAEPFFEEADSLEDYRKVLLFAITAWNLSLLDTNSQKAELEKLTEIMGHESDASFMQGLQSILKPMIDRKQEYYSDTKRLVMDWDYIRSPAGGHLNVVSTII